jgi:hypothetical protein
MPMLKCPKCKNQYKDNITYCVFCGLDLVPVEEDSGGEIEEIAFSERITETPKGSLSKMSSGSPPLSLVFVFLGLCSLVGGFAYAIHLWPEKFSLIHGFIPSRSCFPSLLSLLLGIIACCMCFAMAQIISSLRALEYIMYQLFKKD